MTASDCAFAARCFGVSRSSTWLFCCDFIEAVLITLGAVLISNKGTIRYLTVGSVLAVILNLYVLLENSITSVLASSGFASSASNTWDGIVQLFPFLLSFFG